MPPTPDEIEAQEAAVMAAETAAAAQVSADLRAQVRALLATYAAISVLSDEDRSRLIGALEKIKVVGMDARLRDQIRSALLLGDRHASGILQHFGDEKMKLPRELRYLRVESHASGLLRMAVTLARVENDPAVILGVAGRALSDTERTTRYGVNGAHAAGVRQVSDAAGAGRLWIAERDACVHCLAYAGEIAEHGIDFPGGLSFALKPLVPHGEPVGDPPLHPNCRCRTVPWLARWGREYADSLRREARRSIARGWSLPSESERSRLAAAELLLTAGNAGLPHTVAERARRDVAARRFRRGRRFPG